MVRGFEPVVKVQPKPQGLAHSLDRQKVWLLAGEGLHALQVSKALAHMTPAAAGAAWCKE